MFGNYYVTLHDMDSMNRREWLARVGSLALGSLVMSSCESGSRHVSQFTGANDKNHEPISIGIINCRQCDACMPCEYGVDNPGNFALLNASVKDKKLPDSSESPDFYDLGSEFLAMYEAEIPDKAQAQHCICCDKCLSVCRHGVNISKELEKITALTDLLRDYRSMG